MKKQTRTSNPLSGGAPTVELIIIDEPQEDIGRSQEEEDELMSTYAQAENQRRCRRLPGLKLQVPRPSERVWMHETSHTELISRSQSQLDSKSQSPLVIVLLSPPAEESKQDHSVAI